MTIPSHALNLKRIRSAGIVSAMKHKWGVVILAAGKGTRMESELPKVLHRVCGKEMVRHVADAVREVADGPVVVVVSPESAGVRQCLGSSVAYVEQREAKGTGHALQQAEKVLAGKVSNLLVLYGDIPLLLPSTIGRIVKRHETSGATVTLLTAQLDHPDGLGRILRGSSGSLVSIIEGAEPTEGQRAVAEANRILGIVEEADATEAQRGIAEVNGGVYGFRSEWLWPALSEIKPSRSGEYYLTELVGLACSASLVVESVISQEAMEILGVNTRVQLAQAEQGMRERILRRWMLGGVTVMDPATTYVDAKVEIGVDSTLYPGTALRGETKVGKRCSIGPNAMIHDSVLGDDCKVVASMLEEARLENGVDVGPFSHLRPGAVVEEGVHIGNYVEVKNSRIGRQTKVGHFSYIGDADVGKDVNIGAGTVTCNFDGVNKNVTVIGDEAFIGSDTMLVAPVRVGARASTGAGSVVNKDVPPDSVAVGVPARVRAKRQGKRDVGR